MSNEQNLEEMLISLQRSVDDLDENNDVSSDGGDTFSDMSTSDLQKILEEKYFSDGSAGIHESDGSYMLDSDVLAEFSVVDGEEALAELEEEPAEEEPVEEEPTEELDEIEDLDSLNELNELDLFEDLTYILDNSVEKSESVPVEPDPEPAVEPIELEELDEFDELLDVIDMQTDVDLEISEEAEEKVTESEVADEETVDDEQNAVKGFDAFSYTQAERPRSFKALMMDYGRPDPEPVSVTDNRATNVSEDDDELETPDLGDILSDFTDDSPTQAEKMNSEMRKLMTSLGCEDELNEVSAADIGAIYGQFGKDDSEENDTTSAEFVESTRSTYKKRIISASLKVIGCALLTLIMFFYDTLPMFDVDFFGLADYVSYPGAYVMLGTQLLLICAACLWSYIWDGIKGLLTVYPNIYSMAVVLVSSCAVYDTVFFITRSYKPLKTPMFHFLCGVFLTVVAIYTLVMRVRESSAYNTYSSDVAKFTLSRDGSQNSIAEKMYKGGFSRDKKVYMPSPVSDPKGFFESIADDGGFGNVVCSSLILMSVGIGVIFGIILMIVGRSLDEGVIAAMTTIMVLMPVSAVMAVMIPVTISWLRLRKRGIALTGRRLIRKYGAENALVFSDLHLFGKCDTKQVGFVCYEKAQTQGVLAALNILYSRIGGPMGEVFANIPDEHKAKSIRVRRITRSGIEAVVDKSHILIVGDISFLRRYGIEFSNMEKDVGKGSTLYVSLDGRASARFKAVYKVEPVFDMLIERLASEGIHCVIETYDPMINTDFAARHRRLGNTPISVVHKNAADINRATDNEKKRSDHGLLVLSSRLKLVEAVVWCARLCKIEKLLNIAVFVSVGVGLALIAAPAIFGVIPCFIQYLLFAYLLMIFGVILTITLKILPSRDYFTVGEIERQREEQRNQQNKKKESADK